MKRISSGFTLVELLIVLAIVGILLVVITVNAAGEVRRNALREAASIVLQQTARARDTSLRTSRDQVLSWTPSSITWSSTVDTRTFPLPRGTKIITPSSATTYQAPWGELQTATGGSLRLELQDTSDTIHTAIDLVGVTGKAIWRSTEAVGTDLK
jgi:prepilin-type N-terminal cleavage/methylation domain-containing protein